MLRRVIIVSRYNSRRNESQAWEQWLADYRVKFSFNFNVRLSIIAPAAYQVIINKFCNKYCHVMGAYLSKDGGDDKLARKDHNEFSIEIRRWLNESLKSRGEKKERRKREKQKVSQQKSGNFANARFCRVRINPCRG